MGWWATTRNTTTTQNLSGAQHVFEWFRWNFIGPKFLQSPEELFSSFIYPFHLTMTTPPMFDQARQPCGHACDSIDSIGIFQDDNQRIEHANAGGLANLPTSSIATVDLNASPLGNMNFGGVRQCSVSSHTVLRGGGVVLGNVDDEKKHGYVSEHSAERYDFFISHNWSVERWKKFLALCLIWSGKHALISSCFMQLLTFSLVVMGILPVSTSCLAGAFLPQPWSPKKVAKCRVLFQHEMALTNINQNFN